ncbi:MAG: helix-turn-helix domain-containing protein [Oscillospiraceae bacterium]|nr:helix-turn-helix domain-containing protein [Oscillospiraceae bacterium]
MSKQFDSMMEGLTELLEYAKGDRSKCRTRVVEVKSLNVTPLKQYSEDEIKSLRVSHNLTQKTFAQCLGVSQKTVESWERGENSPSGSSVRLLQMLERNSNILEECEILTPTDSMEMVNPAVVGSQ